MTTGLMRLYLDLNQANLDQIQISLNLLKEKQRHFQKWRWIFFLLGEGTNKADYKNQLRNLKGDLYVYNQRLDKCREIISLDDPHQNNLLLEQIDAGRVQADILMGKLIDEITRVGLG